MDSAGALREVDDVSVVLPMAARTSPKIGRSDRICPAHRGVEFRSRQNFMKTPPRSALYFVSSPFRGYALAFLAALLFGLTLATSLFSWPAPQTPHSPSPAGQLETQMWALINRDRADQSYSDETMGRARALQWDERPAAVARAHSEEMARNGYFSHEGSDGSST